jgi:DGQHR domain-containing protein
MSNSDGRVISLTAIKGKILSTTIYRGFAPLGELAQISRADRYDPTENPNGTQRELNKKHAWEAYQYAQKASEELQQLRMWPEIVLNIRNNKGIYIEPKVKAKHGLDIVRIKIHLNQINRTEFSPSIARVDGNHRLFYAGGEEKYDKKFPPELEIMSTFAILDNASIEDERRIFIDINRNQKGVDTSHLAEHLAKLTADDIEWRDYPGVWLAREFSHRPSSPFEGIVSPGPKRKEYLIKLKPLADYLKLMLTEINKSVDEFSKVDRERIYSIFENYWTAVRQKWPDEWKNNKTFVLMSSSGIYALSLIGAALIERQFLNKKCRKEDFITEIGKLGQHINWKKSESTMKLTGRQGAEDFAKEILSELPPRVTADEVAV